MSDEGAYGTKEYLRGKTMTHRHVAEDTKPCDRPRPEERHPSSGPRVLIVDDDANVCRSLKDLLSAEGCCVDTADSGVHGLQRLQGQSFDLVLSDVVMPDMDGYELHQAVKKATPSLPVVLMTAF